MNKYGSEHFHIKLIEETNNPEERERYWIQYYDSYHNGYNATLGGDGKCWLELPEEQIICDYKDNNFSICSLADKYHCDKDTIKKILKNNNIKIRSTCFYRKKKVKMIDKKTGQVLKIYESIQAAEIEHPTGHNISRACNGKRKSAGGYCWEYVDE